MLDQADEFVQKVIRAEESNFQNVEDRVKYTQF